MKQDEREECKAAGGEARFEQKLEPQPIAGVPATAAATAECDDDTRKAGERDGKRGNSHERLGIIELQSLPFNRSS